MAYYIVKKIESNGGKPASEKIIRLIENKPKNEMAHKEYKAQEERTENKISNVHYYSNYGVRIK